MMAPSVVVSIVLLIYAVESKIGTPNKNELLPYEDFLRIKKETNECPCNNVDYCENVKKIHSKELFGFTGGYGANVSIYNWTYLTSIAWASTDWTELMCYAHKNDVRLIAATSNIPFTDNKTERAIWIKQTFEQIEYFHFDGITFDYESPMLWDSIPAQQYTALINETTQYFHSNMPGSQVSVCVAWQAYDVDGRQYPYYDLSLASDLLYVMDYDTQSQNSQHQCLAAANAPFQGSQRGIRSYLNLGIDANKLILGVPWYGYQYPCDMEEMESTTSKYCPIPFDTFRGVNCSDAAGSERAFGILNNLLDEGLNITEVRWDTSMRAPYFNYMLKGNDKQVYQAWFDNEESLRLKYEFAKSVGIRGVGPFTYSQVYHTFSTNEMDRAQAIWSSFDAFFI